MEKALSTMEIAQNKSTLEKLKEIAEQQSGS